MIDEHATIFRDLWDRLSLGSAKARHAFHLPTLGTVAEDGRPQLRTVVLRRVDEDARLLCCHTDQRSPKIRDIHRSPTVAWLFYDAEARIQVRAAGSCTVHAGDGDPVARTTWQGVAPRSRVCYNAPYPPSVEVPQWESNLPPEAATRAAGTVRTDATPPPTFAVLATTVSSLEWLELHHDGHRRIRFTYSPDGAIEAQWITP